ncbi:MAG: OmpH family outer membrane protein [Planctomycetes bacterium]|nr:OmpH family outer membrane protein [Planctomycetota bacterium]
MIRTYARLTRWTLLPAMALGLAAFAGCGDGGSRSGGGSGPTGSVAILDLDRVAKELGRDVAIMQTLQQEEKSLNTQLDTLKNNYIKVIEEEVAKVTKETKTPSDEQKTKLDQTRQFVASEFEKKVNEAKSHMQSRRSELIIQFRTEVRPIALRIAESRGMTVVITLPNDWVLEHSNSSDITADVINELKHTNLNTAPATTGPSNP